LTSQNLKKQNKMKLKIFNLFPLALRQLPYADKIVHAIFGTAIYVFLLFFIENNFAFAITVGIALLVEVYDKVSKKGTVDPKDAFFTFIIPFLLFVAQEMIF
jgi:hypothetical protein